MYGLLLPEGFAGRVPADTPRQRGSRCLMADTPGGLAAPGGVRMRAERAAGLVLAGRIYGAHGLR
jgi:hypothetical protein